MLSLFIVSKTCCYFLFEINILFLQIDVNFAIFVLGNKANHFLQIAELQ